MKEGIARLMKGDVGVSIRLEPVFDSIYELSDTDFLDLVEQLSFVYAYQHLGTEDCGERLADRVSKGLQAARETLERDAGE